MIYIASPYSHPDPLIRKTRFLLAERFVVHLIQHYHLFAISPIVYGHKMAEEHKLPTDAEFWYKFNSNILRRAEAMFLLELPGWQQSKGVAQEIELCEKLRLPVYSFNSDFQLLRDEDAHDNYNTLSDQRLDLPHRMLL